MSNVKVQATKRFSDNFNMCADKGVIIREIAELLIELERKSGLREGNARNIKTLRGPIRDVGKRHGLSLQEWKLTKRSRLVFDFSEALNLIDFAPDDTHTAVEDLDRLSNAQLGKVLDSLSPVSAGFRKLISEKYEVEVAVESLSGEDRSLYDFEPFDEWIRFLDKPQLKVRDEILSDLVKGTSPGIHVLLGGPGTGKTMVLIDLALEYELATGITPTLRLPAGVKHYVTESGQFLPSLYSSGSSVVLIDDPATFEELEKTVVREKALGHTVVIGIDPTQWHARRTIEKFSKFMNLNDVKRHELSFCYRQGGVVGRQAVALVQKFLSQSSAFAAEERVFAERSLASDWEKLCLEDITFADEDGHFNLYENDYDLETVFFEQLQKAASFQTARNWPKVLIGCPNKNALPDCVKKALERAAVLYPELKPRIREFRQVTEVRGTEYETVLVVIDPSQLQTLRKGVKAASTPDWERATSLLAFFTRAENRLAIFSTSEVLTAYLNKFK